MHFYALMHPGGPRAHKRINVHKFMRFYAFMHPASFVPLWSLVQEGIEQYIPEFVFHLRCAARGTLAVPDDVLSPGPRCEHLAATAPTVMEKLRPLAAVFRDMTKGHVRVWLGPAAEKPSSVNEVTKRAAAFLLTLSADQGVGASPAQAAAAVRELFYAPGKGVNYKLPGMIKRSSVMPFLFGRDGEVVQLCT